MAEPRVDVTLKDGRLATVPKKGLAQAIKAGAHVTTEKEKNDAELGTTGGQLATGALGAARVATLGFSDAALAAAGHIIGPEIGQPTLREDVLKAIQGGREANPYSNMAGEAAGLFLGGGITAAGEAAEAATLGRLGEGLLGKTAAFGARGAAEGAILGAQQQITEDTLGDHEYNGQAIAAAALKDGLIGGAFGTALGAGSHYIGSAPKGLLSRPGPARDAVLDEVAGTPGAGRQLHADMRSQEEFVESLRRTGATSEQATTIADAIKEAGHARTSGPVSGFIDDLVERAAAWHGSSASPEAAKASRLIREQYMRTVGKAADWETVLDKSALDLSKDGTSVIRDLEHTINDVQFTQKPTQFGRLVDATRLDAQRNAVTAAMQDVDGVLSFWEGTSAKGGAEGAIRSLRKSWKDNVKFLSSIEEGSATAGRDAYIRMDKMKRQLDGFLKWGREHRFGLPEALVDQANGLEPLANRMRSMLEDEATWGRAGPAQARWNGSFSEAKARRDHFMREAGVAIDQERGLRIPEVDFKKARSMLSDLTGGEADGALQSVKSVDSFIDGMRDRVAAIREYGHPDPAVEQKLVEGLKSLDRFELTWKAARTEAAAVNRLKAAVLEEREAMGVPMPGLVGLIGNTVTKPLTAAKRLAQLRGTVARVEEAVAKGLRRSVDPAGVGAAKRAPPRPKSDVVRDIEEMRTLNGNPLAKEDRLARMVGDLQTHAPKTAQSIKDTAARAIDYLAREAPRPVAPIGIIALNTKAKPRYGDQQISDWETKRKAALDPESIVDDIGRGKLNRDAIKTVEFVFPDLFA